MRIAFFGSSLVSAYWNGAATYYRGILRALAMRGHKTTFYEPDAWDRQRHRDIPDPPWATVVVYEPSETSAAQKIEEARGFDIVVKTSGVGVLDDFLEQAVAGLRTGSRTALFWDVDAPSTLDRVRQNPADPFRDLIPRFTAVFTYGGGTPVVEAYRSLGARACIPIYNALDPMTHFRVDAEERFAADLSFLGNRLPDREMRVDEFFFRTAAMLPEMKFLLGGSGWNGKPLPPNVRYLDHVYTRDHNAFNSTPRTVINISRESMARYGFSPATRVFEAAGAEACIVTDEWEGIETFFEPGKEILVAKDAEEVTEHLRMPPRQTSDVGKAAYRRVLAHHTYAHRALAFERALEGRVAGAGAAS